MTGEGRDKTGSADLRKVEETAISRREYGKTWKIERGRAAREYPADPIFRRYRSNSLEFFAAATYPVWYTDLARTRIVPYTDPDATPILFRDLVGIEPLQDELRKRVRSAGPPRAQATAIVEHCSGCDVRVVKDGCRGLVRIAFEGVDLPLVVTEVSGTDWSLAAYDMKYHCRCNRSIPTGGR